MKTKSVLEYIFLQAKETMKTKLLIIKASVMITRRSEILFNLEVMKQNAMALKVFLLGRDINKLNPPKHYRNPPPFAVQRRCYVTPS